jgi:gamma-glutamyltranspeptidase/glutathione hydrolase
MTTIGPWDLRKPAVTGRGGIVASQSRRAAAAGAAILAAGGNAVDAALATGLAVGAVEPWMSGLGGCGFMVVAQPGGGPAQVVDFGLVAAAGLDPARYELPGAKGDQDIFGWPRVIQDRNVIGPESVALPTYVEGIRPPERFGRLARPACWSPPSRWPRRGAAGLVWGAGHRRRRPRSRPLRAGAPALPARRPGAFAGQRHHAALSAAARLGPDPAAPGQRRGAGLL